jgi:hypothetical protein
MKFHIGPPTEDKNFMPEQQGWKSLKEPDAVKFQIMAFPVGLVVTVILYLSIMNTISFHSLFSRPVITLILFILIIPFHEFFHAICFTKFGFTDKTILGIWPKKLLFYTHFIESVHRRRFIFSLLNPFIFLSLIPIIIILIFKINCPTMAKISLINALLSCGDLFGTLMILFQVPSKSLIKNNGWKTYWKITTKT